MKLNEALRSVASASERVPGPRLWLVCGCEPLHLKTFLQASYLRRATHDRLVLTAGLFGDLEGTLQRALEADAELCALLLEWGDLDPRLGLRGRGPWSGARQEQILQEVAARFSRLRAGVARLQQRARVAICAPTLPLLWAGSTPFAQHSAFELGLQRRLAEFLEELARLPRVRVLHPEKLAQASPPDARHDATAELRVGFPYRLAHASVLAELFVQLLFARAPKKGLISDLDDTLWRGLLGEGGIESIAWTQADGAQLHGLYQSLLQQLADGGALLAIASKNDAALVRAALMRSDLLVAGAAFFPVQASWQPKSRSIAAILEAWNVAADALVFVDDDPMELDEVARLHPQLTCKLFPKGDPAGLVRLLVELRELFGSATHSGEDTLRARSVRAGADFARARAQGGDAQEFLRGLAGQLSVQRDARADAARALQLIDKTNQFNLNGERVSEGAWQRLLADASTFLLVGAYTDRYGPLGQVSVVVGRLAAERVVITHWVLSCRAFSRHIEHHMLREVIRLAQGRAIAVRYRQTARNAPMQEFLISLGADLNGPEVLLGADLPSRLENLLPHTVSWKDHA